ncbi:hypothetical protein RT41_GL000571 [Lactococcus fujiensis JCM 16395]|uniref:Uncharacterized protein n=1 Tax=Lactococcus fujiensis JCM 16395 TaxID=1291764 RepID=A0A2A5RIV4_9LACT|nr:hypothetical protein RT41_GL000571 [Lactococcus fujiensis JCM 16395]
MNLLDGTKDFSGVWNNSNNWENDGTYKGLTVKKTIVQWNAINKTFKAPENGNYTFSVYIKSSGNKANVVGYLNINGKNESQIIPDTPPKNDFDWVIKSFSVNLKAGDIVSAGYYLTGSGLGYTLWTAGHKWEVGSTATPWMPSASEVTTADWPSYIGQYTDFMQADSTNPSDYTWSLMRGNDGKDGVDGKIGPQGPATGITQSTSEPTTKYAGMLWQYTGTSNITIGTTVILPQAQYVYDGSNWKIYALSVANLNADTLSAITADLGTVTAGIIKAYIDYTFYNGSATAIPAKAYLKIDATNATQKIALQSPTGVDWDYIQMGPDGMSIFVDSQNVDGIGVVSGRYLQSNIGANGLSFVQSNSLTTNSDGDLVPAQPYTGAGSLYFNGTALVSTKPITVVTDTDWEYFTPAGTFAKGTAASSTMRLKKEGTKGIVHMRAGTLSSALKANIWANFIQVPSNMIPAYETVAVGGSMSGVPVLFYVNSTGMIKLSLMSDMAAAINVMNCYFEYPLT